MRFFLITLILLLCFVPALATDYTLDEGCTLADAIRAANADEERGECPAGDGADLITLTADITLEGELPRVLSEITIDARAIASAGMGSSASCMSIWAARLPAKHPSDGRAG